MESLVERKYTWASDVWAFGVTLWEVLSGGRTPYGALPASEVVDWLQKGKRLELPEEGGPELRR